MKGDKVLRYDDDVCWLRSVASDWTAAHCAHNNLVRWIALTFSLLYDQLAMQHPHLALEVVLARFIGGKLEADGLSSRQLSALVEIRKKDHLRATGCLLAGEVQAHRLAGFDHQHIWSVTAFDNNVGLLNATGVFQVGTFLLGEEKVPDYQYRQNDGTQ